MPLHTNIALETIKMTKFNPHIRTERAQLSGLLVSIQKHGILHPLSLTHDRTLADGHRRYACAKLLEMATVPVAIYAELPTIDAAQLWVILNGDTKDLSPAQWLAAVDAGLPLDTPGFPGTLKTRIEDIVRLVGKEALSRMAELGRSPALIDHARRVCKYVGREDDEFLTKTLRWGLHYTSFWTARVAIEERIPVDMLVEAIEGDKEIRRVWDIAS